MITIVIPAAGASKRMRGRDKLLEDVGGVPLLHRQTRAALATGWPVVVCLRADRPERKAAVEGLGARLVVVPDPEAGMAASIRAGMAAVPGDAQAVMIVPSDMPDLKTVHFHALAERYERGATSIWRGTSEDGTPGHPVLFPARHFETLRNLPDGDGAQSALKGQSVQLCPLPGQVAVTDLDTPEDWAHWRHQQDA